MGQSDEITVSIGIQIPIKALLDAINSDNYEAIKNEIFTYHSFIEDSNNCYNEIFQTIIEGGNPGERNYKDMDTWTWEEYKNHLTKMFQSYGDIHYNKCSPHSEIQLYTPEDPDNLYHQQLLVPHEVVIDSERWGYSRVGTNGSSCQLQTPILDFTKTAKEIDDKMKKLEISNYSLSLILKQHTG